VDNVKVSVICPVYNAQGYIEKNLTTILNQTLKEIEVIIVYSPSVDDTQKILQNFAKTHSKIKCIYNESIMPISFIRNQGLQSASGEYIAFIDDDDFIDMDYLEKLYLKAKSSDFDIVFSSRVNVLQSKVQKYQVWDFKEDSLNIVDSNRQDILNSVYRNKSVVWGRIIRREFIVKNDILFFNDLLGGEDLSFSLLFFIYAKNAAYVKDTYYHHTSGRKGSLSSKLELMVENTLKGLIKLRALLIKRGIKEDLILNSVGVSAADILIGYFNKWNTGLFSRLSVKSIRKILPFVKENIVLLPPFDKLSQRNQSRVFRIKYKIFMFALKNDLYFVPKLTRIARNLIRIVVPK
jgi:glycosyltransferase involved in cell wall biosynthesis